MNDLTTTFSHVVGNKTDFFYGIMALEMCIRGCSGGQYKEHTILLFLSTFFLSVSLL